ncbi:MAG: hypothetical protein RL235_1202, partial [Chlamydiota bacterium]
MAIIIMLLASLFVSISNLFMRKSIDCGGTAKGHLVFQMGTGFLIALALNPVQAGDYSVNAPIAGLGMLAGVIVFGLLFTLGKALEKGPPGITFSILNGATVLPAVIMAIAFGAARGFPYTYWHGVGSALVLAGLFWGSQGIDQTKERGTWIKLAVGMFTFHLLLLCLFQWRAMLFNMENPLEITSLFTRAEIHSPWFLPFMFLTAAALQIVTFTRFEKRAFHPKEMLYGTIGGAANGICTYLMVLATEVASPLENAVIFPVFSVVTIILSNVWGEKLY